MGKPTGFLEFDRILGPSVDPKIRIRDYREFHNPLCQEEQSRQGPRCMECGDPFCQSGLMLGGKVSDCPLNNLILECNHLFYQESSSQPFD